MIKTKRELNDWLLYEKNNYYKYARGGKTRLIMRIQKEHFLEIWKFVKHLRKAEYFHNTSEGIHIINVLLYWWHSRRQNIIGNRLGIIIPINTFDRGLIIAHHGCIIVNPKARIGENCVLHGDACIGNNGYEDDAPVIGKNCDIGIGARILGDVSLGNNIRIGANAVVVKSFMEDGIVLGGIPAQIIRRE